MRYDGHKFVDKKQFFTVFTHPTKLRQSEILMEEMTRSGEHHNDAKFIRRFNRIFITN